MFKFSRSALAMIACGLLMLVLPAAALAGTPATVTVRVEGETHTLLPATAVTTNTTPVVINGNQADSCPGTSALGALQLASGGEWGGKWEASFHQYAVETILGESHPFQSHSYWYFWVDNKPSSEGACGVELKSGESILFFPECDEQCGAAPSPLSIESPPQATVGQETTVDVSSYGKTGTALPAAGATVAFDGASAITEANGQAHISFPAAGQFELQVTAPGSIRTEAAICVHPAGESQCAASPPAPATGAGGASPGSGGGAALDTGAQSALTATVTSPRQGRRYRRGGGPRRLAGRVSGGDAVTSVALSLQRRSGGQCSVFQATSRRFRRARCSVRSFFRVAARSSFSYLLRSALPPGHYVLEVDAGDAAGTATKLLAGSGRVIFSVA